MTETTNLKLPFVAPAQAQKHVTVNEAFARLDASVQMSVESRMLTEPPLVVTEGEAYLVAPGAEGDWAGQDGRIASFSNGGWIFMDPRGGWQVWVADETSRLTFNGASWSRNILAQSLSNAALRAEVVEIDFTLSGGLTVEETEEVIPKDASVWGITGRVLETFTGTLSDWSLGVDGAEDRYGSGYTLDAGAWQRGITGQPVTYYTPTRLKLSANGGAFAGGKLRLAIHLMRFELPDVD
jgi:hypothetical protein